MDAFLWSELVALICGLAAILVAFPLAESGIPSSGVLMCLAGLGGAAGIACSMRPDLAGLTRTVATNQGGRMGFRAGLLAALLGGAVTITVTQARGEPLAAKWLAAAMSLLPGALTGMITGAWIARARAIPEPGSSPPPFCLPLPPLSWLMLVIHITISAIGFLSPLFLPAFLRVEPRAVRAEPVVTPPPEPPRLPPPVPQTPPYVYEKPKELDTVPAWRWELIRTESLGRFDSSAPLALSHDGKLLAHVDTSRSEHHLQISELTSRQVSASFPVSAPILRVSFSPDSSRILAVVNDTTYPVRVFDLRSHQTFLLPKPREGRFPRSPVYWWNEKEVAFIPQGKEPTILNLDTLRVTAAKLSADWNFLPESLKRASRDMDPSPIGHSEWPFAFVARPRSYIEPYPDSADTWPVQDEEYLLAFADDRHPYERALTSIRVRTGDKFISPRRSGILLRMRADNTDVLYFGLREAPRLRFELKMPWDVTKAPGNDRFSERIASRQLCAFICGPLLNPMNQTVIAPDRDRVKALVRFSEWQGEDAVVWITEEYAAVETQDVVADLHTWEKGEMKPVGASATSEWFVALPSETKTEKNRELVGSVPSRMERLTVGRDGPMMVVKSPMASPATKPSSPELLQSDKPAASSLPPPVSSRTQSVEEAIREFVRAHHRKASQGDVAGVVADYAEAVDHFDHGTVDRAYILRDEREYHAKLSSQSETVESDINISRQQANLYAVTYILLVRWSKPNGDQGGGTFEVRLLLQTKGQGFEITSHRSKRQP